MSNYDVAPGAVPFHAWFMNGTDPDFNVVGSREGQVISQDEDGYYVNFEIHTLMWHIRCANGAMDPRLIGDQARASSLAGFVLYVYQQGDIEVDFWQSQYPEDNAELIWYADDWKLSPFSAGDDLLTIRHTFDPPIRLRRAELDRLVTSVRSTMDLSLLVRMRMWCEGVAYKGFSTS